MLPITPLFIAALKFERHFTISYFKIINRILLSFLNDIIYFFFIITVFMYKRHQQNYNL
jgi:hypothetical protein